MKYNVIKLCSLKNENEMQQENLFLREQIDLLKRKSIIYKIAIMMLILILSTSNLLFLSKNIQLNENLKIYKTQNKKLEEKNLRLYEENNNLETSYDYTLKLLEDVAEVTVEVDKENKRVRSSQKKQEKLLTKLQRRKKLLSQYEWALYEDNMKTDISYEDIETLKSLCKKKNLSEDTVDLVLALAMTESSGDEKKSNPDSTALGLGQFIEETGRLTYCYLMGNDTYNHKKIAIDGTTNLKMILWYLEYLDIKTNGDINKTIDYYRGLKSKGYKKRINEYLSNRNKKIKNIKISKN